MSRAFGLRALVGMALAVILAPQTVSAQSTVGLAAGRMVAREAEILFRRECLAQTGTAITFWTSDGPRLDTAMSNFVRAAANRDAKAMKALFTREAIRGVKGLDGAILEPERFSLESGAPLRRLALVLGVQGAYAQGVWVQESADPATPPIYFTAVFKPRIFSYSIAQVWVTSEPEYAGVRPQDYCTVHPQPDLWLPPPPRLEESLSSTDWAPSRIGHSGEKSE